MSTAIDRCCRPSCRPTLATLAAVLGDGVFSTSRFRDNLRLFVPPSRLLELLDVLKDRCGFNLLAELGATDYLGYPGRTRARFEVHYVLRNLETSECLVVKAGVDDPDPALPSAVAALAGGRLDGARSLRYVRHSIPRPSRPAAHPDARGVRRLSAPQGLSAARARRAA